MVVMSGSGQSTGYAWTKCYYEVLCFQQWIYSNKTFLKIEEGTEEIFDAFSDMGLVPGTHMVAHGLLEFQFKGSLQALSTCSAHTCMQAEHLCT